jgi:hypothetical protein
MTFCRVGAPLPVAVQRDKKEPHMLVTTKTAPEHHQAVEFPNYTGVIVLPPAEHGGMAVAEPELPVMHTGHLVNNSPVIHWLVEPTDRDLRTSAHDRACRGRATALACRASAARLESGSAVMRLYHDLEAEVRKPKRFEAVRALAVTMTAAYLRHCPAGDVFAVRAGDLASAAGVRLDDRLDGVARLGRFGWTIDVFSVAKRRGQLSWDCSSGRVQRSVDLGLRLVGEENLPVLIRVFAPGHPAVGVAKVGRLPVEIPLDAVRTVAVAS